MNAGDLRCKVNFYMPDKGTNEMGESIQDGLKAVAENVPAQIMPKIGSNPGTAGDLDDTVITHKIRIRREKADSIGLDPSMVIMYDGQRYDVRYWMPVYNNERFVEIHTVMEMAI